MIDPRSLARRAYALWIDETLRRWMVDRFFGRTSAAERAQRRHPPYLPQADFRWASPARIGIRFFPPDRPVHDVDEAGGVNLHGRDIAYFIASPSDAIFDERDDLEFRLAIHRFAWLPRHAARLSDADISRVWDWWRGGFISQDDNWAWHPYTAGERILNILDVLETRRIDTVEQTLVPSLNRHLDRIFVGLEYFGNATGNHLTNNGRALYRIGLAIGDRRAIETGLTILRTETRRILDDYGFLREGSTHYQLLITQWLLDVWRYAAGGERAEADELADLAIRVWSATHYLTMGGRYPLFGDISPDRCPADLFDLVLSCDAMATSWLKRLPEKDRAAILSLKVLAHSDTGTEQEPVGDWKRSRWSGWTFLTHVPRQGWNPLPGHGHQDLTSFELHRDGEAVIIDPGRGSYGEIGESYLYRSAIAHSVIEVDGLAPYPLNRGLYSAAFREEIVRQAPICEEDLETYTWTLSHVGFSRLSGVGEAQRRWRWDKTRDSIVIDDVVDGARACTITRRLITPLRVEHAPNGIKLAGKVANYLASGEGAIRIKPLTIWSAYGEGLPGSCIEWTMSTTLPFRAALTISVL